MSEPNHTIPAADRVEPGAVGLSTMTKSKVLIFVAAGLSFVASVALWFSGAREQGLFVGLWVPSILSGGGLLLAGEVDDHA